MSQRRSISRDLLWGRIAAKAVYFMLGISGGTFAANIPRIKENLELTNSSIGLALLCSSIGGFAVMQFAAPLIRRFGLRSLLSVLAPMFPLTIIGIGLAPNLVLLALAFALFGGMASLTGIAINAQAIDIEKAYARSIMTSFHALYSIGGLVGAGIGGIMAVGHLSVAWSMAIIGAGLVLLGIMMIARLFDPAKYDYQEDHTVTEQPRRHHRLKWWRQVLMIGGLVAICYISEGVIGDWSALYLTSTYTAGPFVAVLAYVIFNSSMATGRLLGDGVIRRVGQVPALVGGGALATLGMLIGLLAPHVVLSLVGFGIVGFGLSVLVPILISIAGNLSGGDRNQAIARVSTCGTVGSMVGPASIGFVADHHGLFTGMMIPVVLLMILTAAAATMHRMAARTRYHLVEAVE